MDHRKSQETDADLLPTLKTRPTFKPVVDYAFSFSHRDDEVDGSYEKVSLGGPSHHLSQTTDPFTRKMCLFSGIIVAGDDEERKVALARLALWMAADFEKKRQLFQLIPETEPETDPKPDPEAVYETDSEAGSKLTPMLACCETWAW